LFERQRLGAAIRQEASSEQTLFRLPFESVLNILQVFVYIYGGAMVTGSSSNAQFQGNNFAKKGVIMASFNMRESVFASPNSAELSGTSQNFGILDVEKAMDWIHNNIQGKRIQAPFPYVNLGVALLTTLRPSFWW
jgi:hypothetical protein